MRKILLAALIAAGPVFATDMVVRADKDVLRLSDTACVHAGTLALLKPEYRSQFRKARAQIDGKDWFACWTLAPDGSVFVVFEDGDTQSFPVGIFQPDDGV